MDETGWGGGVSSLSVGIFLCDSAKKIGGVTL